MSTWTTYLLQLRRELEEPDQGSSNIWANESILAWANEAILDLARQAAPTEDEEYATAVIGQQTYELPTGTTRVLAVFFDGDRLTRTSYKDWVNTDTWDDAATPRYYIVDDESLRLIPAPSTAGEIRFFREHYPTAITETSDMPWDGKYNAAIAYYVLRRAMEQIGDWNASNEYAARYADEASKVVSQEIRERNADLLVTPKEVW